MPGRRLLRVAGALLAAVALVVVSGCSVVVLGRPRAADPPPDDATPGRVAIVGAVDGPIDVLARNALADLEDYWAEQFPEVHGSRFDPPRGGYFSVDPADVDPAVYPQGVGCGADPREVENNAFYCSAPQTPNSDSISYDRSYLEELAGGYGRFIPALVMAHEFGHAVQARVGAPRTSIATETQADCLAGAWTAWVEAGEAAHTTIRGPELDQLLRGYLLLRDPVGTSRAEDQAHGSYFDRVSAFQEGFDDGPTACRDRFGPDRVFTQGEFTSDDDFLSGGNSAYGLVERLVEESLPEFWDRAFTDVLDGEFTAPELTAFAGDAPACAAAEDADLVYCPPGDGGGDSGVVAFDEQDLTRPAHEELGDFAFPTAVSIPYALAARDQLGLSTDDDAAVRSAVCLTGWYGAQVYNRALRTVQISPGDLDESVRFLLEYGNDPRVLGEVQLSGFQLVDLFRNGFLQGAAACDVGV
ncbi:MULTISPECIES: neutral zinc metallopeptidase [unclassified Geodermatophilus]|uniref:neutral zinc metallopeptidase n=1 Tax=unclassified Geodermatophilus TaxID=2637632 RepID=UPI003EF0549C